ncbi:hypothetical protein [Maribacter sp. 2308TA10-17]|uniref:hypothetical protein n=1 Tax=Maribacter sp. 2308TA10-17 TaxID=3386276 RepID=UPI0039BD32C4
MSTFQISNPKVENEIHKIIQYLVAAGNSFLPKKAEDGHTNLKSLLGCGYLSTRPLSKEGDVLVFSYSSFAIEWWTGSNEKYQLYLDGKTHKEITNWIAEKAKENDILLPYKYHMSDVGPYEPITDNYVYHLKNKDCLNEIMDYRILSHLALEGTLKELTSHSEIRVWPHHLDVASVYTTKENKQHFIGLGMSIPDANNPNFYLYAKDYVDNSTLNSSNVGNLDYGYWDENLNGVVLELNENSSIKGGHNFFRQAVEIMLAQGIN